jgi:hypothetical protein
MIKTHAAPGKDFKANMRARTKSSYGDERLLSCRCMFEGEGPSPPAERVGMGTPEAIILSQERLPRGCSD